jgi:hypothetical protein
MDLPVNKTPRKQPEILGTDHLIALMAAQDISLDLDVAGNVINQFLEELNNVLNKGYRVETRFFSFYTGTVNNTGAPFPETYIDVFSGRENNRITKGGVAVVRGQHLTFLPKDVRQGIFYLHENGAEHRVTSVGKQSPEEIVFFTPEQMPPGQYLVEIRNAESSNMVLQHGRLVHPLIIE